jgi:hypothetical protein
VRRYGVGITDVVLQRLIREVVEVRAPEQLGVVDKLKSKPLDQDAREALREVLAEELVETGLQDDDEPNERGRLIEAAIDWLGHV